MISEFHTALLSQLFNSIVVARSIDHILQLPLVVHIPFHIYLNLLHFVSVIKTDAFD